MIPIKEFVTLAKALPKCRIAQDASHPPLLWILDKDNNRIGSINMEVAEITIFEEYEYAAQVREAIGEDRFVDTRKDFSTEKENPVKITGDVPELTDYGKELYNPKYIDEGRWPE